MVVHAQDVHCESKCERKSLGFALPLRQRVRNKMSIFYFIIFSVRLVTVNIYRNKEAPTGHFEGHEQIISCLDPWLSFKEFSVV